MLFTIPGTSLGIWHTYAQATSDLNTINAAYPELTQVLSIGKTVQNRDIWAMRITDHPAIDESEPEFLFTGTLHGDEPIGMELSFYFVQHLLENYGTDARLTSLVNEHDIWIVPNLNWDGYSRTPGAWRGNANGVDLNRNFPEWTTRKFSTYTIHTGPFGNVLDGPVPQTAGLQPETVAMMNFRAAHRFVASATQHGGELVVNYPWDSNGNTVADYATAPDDALLRQIALRYSLNHPLMAASSSFPQGITNGDDWYPVSGGVQDWSYLYTGTNELTIELGTTKYPSAATLPTHWNNNRESMLQYLETIDWGLRGTITSAANGQPLGAKVTLVAPAPSPAPDPNHPGTIAVYTDPDAGDYYRMLLPGTYSLEYSAPGYVTQTISNVAIGASAPTTLDVALVPIDNTPPSVVGWQFNFDAPKPAIRVQFSEDVSASLAGNDIELLNVTSGQMVPAAALALVYDALTNTATFSIPSLLADGNYRALLPAGSVSDSAGNPLTAGSEFTFHSLAGDANRDRVVDITDLGILATNWQGTGKNFSEGDFNYDTVVDITDLGMLATNWQKQLTLPAAPAASHVARRVSRAIEQIET